MKVAIIHYWFITRRGGEKVVESILKLYPEADIYTLFYDKKIYGNHLSNHKVYTSILDNRFFRRFYQIIFPLYPLGIKSLKLKEDYDLIISSESGPAKGIKIPNKTPHICYIHSPMRYCWGFTNDYLATVNKYLKPILRFSFEQLRNWDKTTINNVDLFIANSQNVANRVKKYYKKDSQIVFPPISDDLFDKPLNKSEARDVYLSFGAITPYKRIDLLVETFNLNGQKLVIIGGGSELEKIKKKANSNIVFKGVLNWEEIESIFYRSKTLLFPGEEDFGMIPLEVMAYGIPVIAFKKGGALETVFENRDKIEESSGLFFNEQTPKSLQEVLEYFEIVQHKFDPEWIRNYASKFKESIFLHKFSEEVNTFIQNKKAILVK